MPYEYIRSHYGVSPQVGRRAFHKGIKRYGVILPPKPSATHYVHIRFNGEKNGSLSHPMELEYTEPDWDDEDLRPYDLPVTRFVNG